MTEELQVPTYFPRPLDSFSRAVAGEAACPHCGAELDPPPTRGRKCPSCGDQFYVRACPPDSVRRVLCEGGRDEADDQWSEHRWREAMVITITLYDADKPGEEERVEGELDQRMRLEMRLGSQRARAARAATSPAKR